MIVLSFLINLYSATKHLLQPSKLIMNLFISRSLALKNQKSQQLTQTSSDKICRVNDDGSILLTGLLTHNTVDFQWLEHLGNYENMFETMVVRANEN